MNKRFFITILLTVACAAPLSAIDRGLGNPKSVYIPQGTVSVSLTGGYNSWYQENASLKVYDPFDENATDEEKAVWGNADKLIAALGFPTMSPEYEFQPKPIDYAEGDHADQKGQLDKASVTVILADWEEPFLVRPPEKLVDVENDPHIIGYGKMVFGKEMTEYEKFHLDIAYRNDRTPTLLTVVTSSSYLGDYFTGGSGSVVYFDEFQFIYY